jgi:hypothetical protein
MQLQTTVHDWIGKTVWTDKEGHLCPELETPESGKVTLYVDYEKDNDESLIQADVELAIDALGYPAGSRWIGESSLDPDANVVSFIGVFPLSEIDFHVSKLQGIVSRDVLAVFDGKEHCSLAVLSRE